MAGARLPDEGLREPADQVPHGGCRIVGLARRADQPAAHDHAVGAGVGGLTHLLGRADAEAQRDGHVGRALGALDHRGEAVRQRGALPRRPGHRDRVDEPARLGADVLEAVVRGGRRDERHERDPGRVAGLAHLSGLLEGQVGHDQAAGAGGGQRPGEHLRAPGQHEVRVEHDHDREALAEPGADLQDAGDRRARPQRHGARGVDDRPVGQRVGERYAELDEVGAAVGVGVADGQRALQRREAAHEVGHERRGPGRMGEGVGDALRSGHGRRRAYDAGMATTRYDAIGAGYATTRREDPELRARLHAALGDARTVVNVGAGAGSYEPRDRHVIAIEPSDVMAAQRPRELAPAIRASAGSLPLRDDSVDAAMALVTIHHWDAERETGVRELRRVARGPVIVVTYDPVVSGRMWLAAEYVPEVAHLDDRIFPPPERVAEWLGGDVRVEPLPIPRDCTDWMFGSFWAHPERVLDPIARANTSGFARMKPGAVERAAARLAADLDSGAWDARHGALRELDAYDAGLRLIVAS